MKRMPGITPARKGNGMDEQTELADDGFPLSDIDPQTGWQYGEVGA
jgi:hypothetical protein